MRTKLMAAPAQLGPQFLVVVDFAVESDGCVAIIAEKRLVSRL
jgi:hypothetical protein